MTTSAEPTEKDPDADGNPEGSKSMKAGAPVMTTPPEEAKSGAPSRPNRGLVLEPEAAHGTPQQAEAPFESIATRVGMPAAMAAARAWLMVEATRSAVADCPMAAKSPILGTAIAAKMATTTMDITRSNNAKPCW
jgi:hypothetical protein